MIETIPISDFIWRDPATGNVCDLLVERKAVKDIVGRSEKNDQTRQLERMHYTNSGGTNVLLIDGEISEVSKSKAFDHGGRPSVWDPEIRYFDKEIQGQTTAIVKPEHLLVYLTCLMTNGAINVMLAGEQTLGQLLASYTVCCGNRFKKAFTDLNCFNRASKDVRKLQTESPTVFNSKSKLDHKRKQERSSIRDYEEYYNCRLQHQRNDTEKNFVLRFATSGAFWEEYKAGMKKKLSSFSLNGADSAITKFGRNLKNIEVEGTQRLWFEKDNSNVEYDVDFEQLPLNGHLSASGDKFAMFQCFNRETKYASVQFFAVWQRGEELLTYIHTQLVQTESSGCSIAERIRQIAQQFTKHYFREKGNDAHQRLCLLLTNLPDGRKKYNQAISQGRLEPLSSQVAGDDLLSIFLCTLTRDFGATCLNLGQIDAARIVQYASFELVRQVAQNQMHFS